MPNGEKLVVYNCDLIQVLDTDPVPTARKAVKDVDPKDCSSISLFKGIEVVVGLLNKEREGRRLGHELPLAINALNHMAIEERRNTKPTQTNLTFGETL